MFFIYIFVIIIIEFFLLIFISCEKGYVCSEYSGMYGNIEFDFIIILFSIWINIYCLLLYCNNYYV